MSSNPQTFRPERTHLLAAGVLFLICLLVLGAKPLYLFWLPLLPLVFVVWVLRSSTTVDERGIHVRYAFAQGRSVSWEEFAGIGFEKARSYARTTDGEKVALTAVTFNSLPRLAEASSGRIPDALTAGRNAADDKVVVIHRDGRQVLKPREEAPAEPTDQPTD